MSTTSGTGAAGRGDGTNVYQQRSAPAYSTQVRGAGNADSASAPPHAAASFAVPSAETHSPSSFSVQPDLPPSSAPLPSLSSASVLPSSAPLSSLPVFVLPSSAPLPSLPVSVLPPP